THITLRTLRYVSAGHTFHPRREPSPVLKQYYLPALAQRFGNSLVKGIAKVARHAFALVFVLKIYQYNFGRHYISVALFKFYIAVFTSGSIVISFYTGSGRTKQ